ncbi:MAG: hypothetical protein P8X82_13360 [Gemmatimonadales bacterium]
MILRRALAFTPAHRVTRWLLRGLIGRLDDHRFRRHVLMRAGAEVVAELRREAQAIWDEDQAMCRAIGEAGAVLVPERATVMTIGSASAPLR